MKNQERDSSSKRGEDGNVAETRTWTAISAGINDPILAERYVEGVRLAIEVQPAVWMSHSYSHVRIK